MKFRARKRKRFRVYLTTESKIALLIVCTFLFGIIIGSLISSADGLQNILIGYAQSITTTAPTGNILLNDFILSFISFAALFLLGLSVYGYIFIPVFPFIKGFSYGFCSAFVYGVFGAKGIIICLLGILPQTIIVSLALLIGAYYAFIQSRSLYRRDTQNKTTTRRFSVICLMLFAISLLGAVFDVLVTGNVIQIFS